MRTFALLVVTFFCIAAIQAGEPQRAPPAGGPFAKNPDLPGNLFNSPHFVASSPLQQEWAHIPMQRGRLRTMIVYPEGAAKAPVVIVMHYDSGLDSLQQALAVQLAQHGFIAVAPDLLSELGPDGGDYGSFAYPDAAMRAVLAMQPAEAMRRYKVAYDYAKTLPRFSGKVATLGSGLGGTHSFRFAAEVPELNAAVVFYGSPPDERALARIKAPVLGLYGGDDPEVTATVEPTTAAMKKLGKVYQPHVYPGATHFFMSYAVEGGNAPAIEASWPAAVDFLNRNIK